jgi:hypothetical protein
MRKVLFFMLCVFFALAIVASSAEFYNCVDKNGNSFITDNPPQDAKCKSKGGDDESASQQQQSDVEAQKTKQDDKTTSQKGDIKKLLKIPRVGY